jgi:predicted ArsR family transcriptional regulator
VTDEGRAQLRHVALASPVRQRMLRLMREAAEPLDAAQLGELAGLHVTTARFHLGQLEAAGLVVRELAPATGRGRPRVTFRASAEDAEVTALRELVAVLAGALAEDADGGSARARAAGRAWAAAHPARPGESVVDALTRVFDELGFAPALSEDGARLMLYGCPFRDIAREHRGAVCGAHAGLLAGIVQSAGGAETDAALLPFVEPTVCAVELRKNV